MTPKNTKKKYFWHNLEIVNIPYGLLYIKLKEASFIQFLYKCLSIFIRVILFFQSQSSVEEEIEIDNIQIATTNIDEDMEIRGKKVMKKHGAGFKNSMIFSWKLTIKNNKNSDFLPLIRYRKIC